MASYDADEAGANIRQSQTVASTDKKCSNCGGPATFDPASGKIVCEYCGHEETIPTQAPPTAGASAPGAGAGNATRTAAGAGFGGATGAQAGQANRAQAAPTGGHSHTKLNRSGNRIPGIPIEEANAQENFNWGDEKKSVKCKSCGASIVYDATQISDTCPYCESTLVTAEETDKAMGPQGIIPFVITKEDVSKKFKEWVGGLWFTPNDLKNKAVSSQINGIYAPYWAYDTYGEGDYRGEYGVERKERDSQGNEKTVVDWYKTQGQVSKQFDDHLILAEEKENAQLIKAIEPFKMEACVPYQPQYVAGFIAERYAKGVNECWTKAQEELNAVLKDMAIKDIKERKNTTHARVNSLTPDFYDTYFKYILLPLWLSSYRYNGKLFHYVVNGQTGEVQGDSPTSWLKVIFFIISIAALGISILEACGEDGSVAYILPAIGVAIFSLLICKFFG